MATLHPIQTLCSTLEAQRFQAVERMAAHGGAPDAQALQELAALHTSLLAVREELEAHSIRLGWGDADEAESANA